MFYSDTVILQKGPLSKVWLAAHLEKKMNKAQFIQTSIVNSVGALMDSERPPLALRLSGQLLLGMARIYSRKAKYLLEDCTEALLKIRMAFRTGAVDMIEATVAQRNTITLPEALTEFDVQLPNARSAYIVRDYAFLGAPRYPEDASMFARGLHDSFNNNVSALRDITLPDQSFDASMIARRDPGSHLGYYREDILGQDDDFRFDFADDILPGGDQSGLEGSALDIEVARRASLTGFNEAGIFGSASGMPFDEKSGILGQGSFLPENLGPMSFGSHLGLGAGSGFADGQLLGDLSGSAMQFQTSLGMVPQIQPEELGWDQAEADLLLNPHADDILMLGKRKRKRGAGYNLIDEETIYPISKLRETFIDPSPLLEPPTYLPPTSDISSLPNFSSGSLGRLFDFPPELHKFFEKQDLNVVENMIQAQKDFIQSVNKIREGGQLVPSEEKLQSDWDRLFETSGGFGLDTELRIPEDNDEFRLEGDYFNFDENPFILADGSIIIPEEAKQLTTADISFGNTEFDLQLKSIMDSGDLIDSAENQQSFAQPGAPGELRLFSDPLSTDLTEQQPAALTSDISSASQQKMSSLGFSKSTIEAAHILARKGIEVGSRSTRRKSTEARLEFSNVTKDAPRSDVVKMFFEVLVLKTKGFVETDQQKPFGKIDITPLPSLYDIVQ
ncbi:hypothetical protein BB560_001984 [Smittium megazygosporum]|uniref:Rad21/Rec8-like protein N-terminal domain-containing protein n=1 Tax=Smittium megazygosporum TaxID=133381 RepID=A0A2T9ZG39_9FUNG|nr:hypothetical protein BB560_001984 [Smittium megazygosporum]